VESFGFVVMFKRFFGNAFQQKNPSL